MRLGGECDRSERRLDSTVKGDAVNCMERSPQCMHRTWHGQAASSEAGRLEGSAGEPKYVDCCLIEGGIPISSAGCLFQEGRYLGYKKEYIFDKRIIETHFYLYRRPVTYKRTQRPKHHIIIHLQM